jgi:hypothetical protein
MYNTTNQNQALNSPCTATFSDLLCFSSNQRWSCGDRHERKEKRIENSLGDIAFKVHLGYVSVEMRKI